ncbi:MAG: 7-cyano-7-deazaguanine synthase [Methanonatronarchaeales archaeon]|nr:7-cyano-7-deazaguanine synthase [Methanonatronarchaeales archaeon]
MRSRRPRVSRDSEDAGGILESVVLASGGIDSAVTLAEAAEVSGEVAVLFFRYGQPTESREARCVEALAEHHGYGMEVLDLTDVFSKFRGGLTDKSVDLSVHLAEDGVAASYVPMRNTVFLSIAAGVAESRGAKHLWFGPNAEDRDAYADCRDEYASAMERALCLGTDRAEFTVHRPVVALEKHEIILRGVELEVPLEHTWSCYQDGDEPCGVCASCEERAEGFERAGVEDPL